eukprot:TRINITY_DN106262_c0_g1_i1.p1 TRINITY_DN106262_c0_g1~~TRINITY_DN106262_c0_g1_i1.p1  ORF type:complete len:219 (+),score=37.02 TRINITY_DN106262_c0_g1_i1:68-724(+)
MGQSFDKEKEQRYQACKNALHRLNSEQKGEPGTVYQAASCAICLDDFETTQCDEQTSKGLSKVLECGHKFHMDCIEKWMERSDQCPLCRHAIVSNRDQPATKQPAHAMPESEYDFRVNRAHEIYSDFVTLEMVHAWTTPGFEGSLADHPTFVAAGDSGHDSGFFGGLFGGGDGGHHGGDDGGGHHSGGDWGGDGDGDGGGAGCGGGGGGCGGGCGGGD